MLAFVKQMSEFVGKFWNWQDTMMANLKKYKETVTVEKFPSRTSE